LSICNRIAQRLAIQGVVQGSMNEKLATLHHFDF
jgi:hypothetical protein